MMGYKSPNPWSENQRRKYILTFDWEKRGEYPHSCAEGEARLQSMELQYEE